MPTRPPETADAQPLHAQSARDARSPCAGESAGATAASIVALLAATLPYSTLDRSTLADFAQHAHRRAFHRGDVVWRAGDSATSFHVVVAGLVKIVRRNDGEDAIVSLFGPKESIGDMAMVARGRYPADAIAASKNVQIVSIDGDVVLAQMQRHPELSAAMNRALLHHTEALQEKIRIMSAGSVPRRLATLLVCLAERFGDEIDDRKTIVPVALARTELAKLVGATVETTIRVMRSWERRGLVHTQPDGFLISSDDELRAIATGAVDEERRTT